MKKYKHIEGIKPKTTIYVNRKSTIKKRLKNHTLFFFLPGHI